MKEQNLSKEFLLSQDSADYIDGVQKMKIESLWVDWGEAHGVPVWENSRMHGPKTRHTHSRNISWQH